MDCHLLSIKRIICPQEKYFFFSVFENLKFFLHKSSVTYRLQYNNHLVTVPMYFNEAFSRTQITVVGRGNVVFIARNSTPCTEVWALGSGCLPK